MKKIKSLIIITLLIFCAKNEAIADVWRCSGGLYTSNPDSYESGTCEQIKTSIICGSGSNKFYTPPHSGMESKDIACAPEEPSRSPIWHGAEKATFSKKSPDTIFNFERKLVSADIINGDKKGLGTGSVETFEKLISASPVGDHIKKALSDFQKIP